MELVRWAAYYVHEPFGNEWAAFARLAGYVAAGGGHRDPESVERNFPPVRFERPIEEEVEREQQSPEEVAAVLGRVMAQLRSRNDGGGDR